ncbi:hypothetical protein [Microbispora sp. H10836]|uniref:hypothetical protein n=1 Tax=Microbispora sp. H10836 TaxID=2729106 RepID=UPI001473E1F5|nr:hypothetical protein [Microbispora sp. H10836]
MTRVRRLGTTAVIVSTALASALVVGAAPAYAADAEILSPGDGEVLKSSRPVTVSAKTDWYQVSMSLYVEGPSVSRQKIASGGANQTISGSFDPGDAPNGMFTVSLFGEVTHKTYATSTFVLSRPPEAPSGVEAQLKGPSTIQISWAKGAEPDLRSYEITSVKAGKSGSVSADSACSGSTCQASLALPAGLGGRKVDVSVRAFRSDGLGGTVGSQRSSAPEVSVPAPKASPSPSPTPSKKPDQSAARPPVATTPKAHRPTAAPKPEPALPEDTTLPEDTELPKDTELTLPEANGGSDQTEPVVVPEKTDDPKMTAQSSFLPLGGLNFGVYVALAVVLLLTGANLGAWLRRKGLTGDTAGNGRPGDSGAHPMTGETGASPEAATVVGGAAALGGTAAAKARGTTPVRRPSVILARPKARENSPETEIDTGAGAGDVASTIASTTASATVNTGTDAGQEATLSDQESAHPLARPDQQEPLPATTEVIAGEPAAAEATSATPTAEDQTSGPSADGAHSAAAGVVFPGPLSGDLPASAVLAEGEPPVRSALGRLASLPPLTASLGGAGQAASAHVPLSSAGRPGQMPMVPAPAVPAGAAVSGQMPERPLRQPEPDVWTEDDDSLYSGRHCDP